MAFRDFDTKCFGMDFTLNSIVPDLEKYELHYVLLKLDFSSQSSKPWSSKLQSLGIFLHYPKQLLRSTILLETKDINSEVEGKTIWLNIQNMEVIKRRNKVNVPCYLEWKTDDEKILEQKAQEFGCQPSHWKLNLTSPKCLEKIKLRLLKLPSTKRVDEKFLEKRPPPCRQIKTINYSVNEIRGTKPTQKGSSGNATKGFKKGRIYIKVRYQQNTFKYIKNVRAFNAESLIGNVGGYVGMCLGYTLLQLPNFFQAAYCAIKKSCPGKVYS